MKDQTVLVVGGSSGMGLAIARATAAAGAKVIIASRDAARRERAAREMGHDCRALQMDITDNDAVNQALAQAGPLNHLVLAASGNPAWGPFANISVERLAQAMEGKLYGYWRTIQAALGTLGRDGSILMLSGAAARTGMPGTAGLAAVNGAINQMAQTLAKELSPLRVNVISPGLFDTPAYDGLGDADKKRMFADAAARLPVGRTGRPEDVGPAAVALMSGGFTTGALVDIDGGAR